MTLRCLKESISSSKVAEWYPSVLKKYDPDELTEPLMRKRIASIRKLMMTTRIGDVKSSREFFSRFFATYLPIYRGLQLTVLIFFVIIFFIFIYTRLLFVD